jgi:hypothetical protein
MNKFLITTLLALLTLTFTGCDEAALTAAQVEDSSAVLSSSSSDTIIDTSIVPIDTTAMTSSSTITTVSSSSISTGGIVPTLPSFMYNRNSPVDTTISTGITTKVILDNNWNPIDTVQYNGGFELDIEDWGVINNQYYLGHKYYVMGEGDYINDAGAFHEYSIQWEVEPGATVPFMGGNVLLMEGPSVAQNGTSMGTVHAYLMYIAGKVAIAYWWDTCTYQGPSFCDGTGKPQRYLIL